MSIETVDQSAAWGAWAAAGADSKADLSELEGEDLELEEEEKQPTEIKVETSEPISLELTVKQLQAELEALKAVPSPTKTPDHLPVPAPVLALKPEQLEALKDFPELLSVFETQNKALQAMHDTVGNLTARETQRQADEAALIAATVQAEINRIPALAHWQKNAPEVFAEGIKLDDLLRSSQPGLSREARFVKVAELLNTLHGDPVEKKQKPDPDPVKEKKQETKPAVQAKTKQAVVLLGDLPGGEPNTGQEEGTLENATATDLVFSMWGKSRDEQEKMFKRMQ